MTNEEKAKEIANSETLYGEDSDENSKIEECYIAAMAMAEWKDAQLNKILDEIYNRVAGSCASQDSIIRNTILEIKEKLK